MSNKEIDEEIDEWINEMNKYFYTNLPNPNIMVYNIDGPGSYRKNEKRTREYYTTMPKRALYDVRQSGGEESDGLYLKEYFENLNPNGNSPGVKKCKRSQKLNRKTSRCRKTPCAKGETRDVSSRRCRKKKCSPRKTRDVTSHRCRKKKSPGRKSPKRKSPGRKSPKRKSPKRKSPTKKSRK